MENSMTIYSLKYIYVVLKVYMLGFYNKNRLVNSILSFAARKRGNRVTYIYIYRYMVYTL